MIENYRLSEINLNEFIGKQIIITGILSSIELRLAKNNTYYADIKLKDKDTEASIKWFGFEVENRDVLEENKGKVFAFYVNVQTFKNSVSLNTASTSFDEVCGLTDEDPRDYLNVEDTEGLFNKIQEFLKILEGYPLYDLVVGLLNDNEKEFMTHGAASSFHHTGIGGLVLHSVSVCELACMICDYYNKMYGPQFVNKKLLIAGSLLHDIGKIYELDFNLETAKSEYSNLSVLESHPIIGIKMVAEKAQQLGLTNRTELDELIHLIASHHGRKDYGALIDPSMIEAKILSMADDMDAAAYRFNKAYENMEYSDSKTEWASSGKLSYYKSSIAGREPSIDLGLDQGPIDPSQYDK